MTQEKAPPDNPAGPLEPVAAFEDAVRLKCIDTIGQAPARLREAVAGLSDSQLETLYKNWTIRQIAHHIADSHVHRYMLAHSRKTVPDTFFWLLPGRALSGICESGFRLLSCEAVVSTFRWK